MSNRSRNMEHGSFTRNEPKNNLNISPSVQKMVDMVKEEPMEESPKKISDGFKKLMMFGKLSDVVTFGDISIELETLNAAKQKFVIQKMNALDQNERIYFIRLYVLAEAILNVNGQSLESLMENEDNKSSFDHKVEILGNMQSLLLEKLYEKYNELLEKSNNIFNPATPEVTDNLKN